MNCPHCAAESSVVETRRYKTFMITRRRKCLNNHTFPTYEVYAGNVERRTLVATCRGVEARSKSFMRRRAIHLNPELSAAVLARRLGISQQRVRQIRSEEAA